MIITAISPNSSAKTLDILNLVAGLKADLVVLPGYSGNHPTVPQLREVIQAGTHVFLELPGVAQGCPVLITSSDITMLPEQVFLKSPSNSKLHELEACFSHRAIKIGGRSVSFILCGEINAFQLDGGTKAGIKLPFDILINPVHTVMGRWHLLGRKLSSLSLLGLVTHVANNPRGNSSITTDVRMYLHGEQVGEKKETPFAAYCSHTLIGG